ncbi:hypothetical protein [Streptomyces chartreusis]|uniref:Uncharacterized protein n=1 Tax=Streptomyces chartreusis TaxID=1969 RepID=A0A7H8T514_STRCX|nr:hypothetical protein [Streptomyces chartreusis]QKZ18605.1 hypothetical protein HUT05_15240 [Streptomyces chartreusis]
MARTTKPVTWYMATPADGIIKHSRENGTPLSLADAVGQGVIDHPDPCKNKWYDESRFSYFRMVKRVGEVLEDTGIWPVTWPVRLWIVEPVGETGNWSHKHYPYRTLSHQIRVLEETDAWQALGRNGRDVLDVIEHQIPERAVQWAADWEADPAGMRKRREHWRLCRTDRSTSGMKANSLATNVAFTRREAAGQMWTKLLAVAKAEDTIAQSGVGGSAVNYASSRASGLATAAHLKDRFDDYVLGSLRGIDLDNPVTATA